MEIVYLMENKFIKVTGTQFIKDDKPLLFQGVGIGSYLNLEHFMIGLPTPDHQIRTAAAAIFGEEVSVRFFDSLIRNFVTEDDFIFLKKCGVNIIRVPFNYRLFIDDNQPEQLKTEGFSYFDYLLDLCDKYQIYLLPDLHTVPGGQNPDWHSDNATGIPQFWFYKVFRNQIVSLWKAIAEHCADREYLLGYDVLNEPYLMDAPNLLTDFYDEVTENIRMADPHHIIFLEGDHFAMQFDCIERIQDSNTALSFHYYPTVWEPDLFSPAYDREARKQKFREILNKIASIRERFERPILCGEAGYDIDRQNISHTMELLEDTLDLFDEAAISWTLWSYKDAQFMGMCYPQSNSPWMQLVSRIHEKWTHYKEMDEADRLMEAITKLPEFSAASQELKYKMQFRQRGILYKFQEECILKPLLQEYSAEELLTMPDSFLFKNCEYYPEYMALLQSRTKRA